MAQLVFSTIYKALKLSDLDFVLSRSLKVKSDGVSGFAIYVFLLVVMVTWGLTLLLYEITF